MASISASAKPRGRHFLGIVELAREVIGHDVPADHLFEGILNQVADFGPADVVEHHAA